MASDATPAQAAVTPGRAAFEAYARAESGSGIVSIPWDGLADSVHDWWEASAAAVMLLAQATVDYAELQELREAKAPERLAKANTKLKAERQHLEAQATALAEALRKAEPELNQMRAQRDEARAAARRDQELFLLVRTERDHLKAEVARLRELIDNAGLTEVAAEDAAWRKEQGL